jgi:hypothetical protein
MVMNEFCIISFSLTALNLVRDPSAVRRLFVRLAGAVGRQSALHMENSGFVAARSFLKVT